MAYRFSMDGETWEAKIVGSFGPYTGTSWPKGLYMYNVELRCISNPEWQEIPTVIGSVSNCQSEAEKHLEKSQDLFKSEVQCNRKTRRVVGA